MGPDCGAPSQSSSGLRSERSACSVAERPAGQRRHRDHRRSSPARFVVCAAGRTVRNHGRAIQAEGCPERFEFAFYRWIWNYTRDSQPRIDAAHQWHGHLRVIELCQWTRRSMDEFLETI